MDLDDIVRKIDDKIAEMDEKYVEGDARSIKELKNKEKIKYHIFDKGFDLKVFTDRIHSYDKQYDENSPLNQEELDELNWLLDSHIVDTVKDKVLNYCNQNYKDIGENSITDVYPELDLREIYICKDRWHNGIAVLGECNSDPEHGISIKFENRKFSGVGQNADWF